MSSFYFTIKMWHSLTNFNFYCSSFASNLQTSTNGGETFFAIIISAVALILLTYIIGNVQVGLNPDFSFAIFLSEFSNFH